MTPPRIVPYCTIPGLFHDATAGSEDGELHIYAPSGAVPVDGLPVLAFIHGGRFEEGSPAEIDGTALAREGFVVVSIGYRLGLARVRPIPRRQSRPLSRHRRRATRPRMAAAQHRRPRRRPPPTSPSSGNLQVPPSPSGSPAATTTVALFDASLHSHPASLPADFPPASAHCVSFSEHPSRGIL